MNYGQQIVRATRYIGQSFVITLSHANHLLVTIQYPYEKLITLERFHDRIHFEFDKCITWFFKFSNTIQSLFFEKKN